MMPFVPRPSHRCASVAFPARSMSSDTLSSLSCVRDIGARAYREA